MIFDKKKAQKRLSDFLTTGARKRKLTDVDIAYKLGVTVPTLYSWKVKRRCPKRIVFERIESVFKIKLL